MKRKKKSPIASMYAPLYGAAMMGAGLQIMDKFEEELKKPVGKVRLTIEWGRGDE